MKCCSLSCSERKQTSWSGSTTRKGARLGHLLKSASTTAVVASGAVGVVAVFNAMTTEVHLGATEEAFRIEGEAAVEEATIEEVSRLA